MSNIITLGRYAFLLSALFVKKSLILPYSVDVSPLE